MTGLLRVHRVPFSTNVERVALGAGIAGVTVQWVDHDAADRTAVRALSGQDLVPVAETPDGEVIVDSMAILRWIDDEHPSPPLWPTAAGPRAQAEVFTQWFNAVWKVAPNAIAAAREAGTAPDAGHVRALESSVAVFDGLLDDGRDFLLGDEVSVADIAAHPFLRYGTAIDPADDEVFHQVLHEHLAQAAGRAALRRWIDRVAALPRA